MGVRILIVLVLSLVPILCRAANPSFSNFDTSQFGTANNKVVIKSGALITNLVAINEFYIAINGTNYLEYEPGSANGATPYTWKTELLHTTGHLFDFENAGTNVFWISPSGGVLMGRDTAAIPPADEWAFYASYNPALGDPIQAYMQLFERGPNTESYGLLINGVTTNSAYSEVTAVSNLVSETWITATYPIIHGGYWQYIDDRVLINFQPGAGAGQPPYLLDTYLTHTSGNLFEVKNNETFEFNVTFDGGIKGGTPAGGTAAAWKPGIVHTGVSGLVLTTTNYVELDIGGVLKKVALVQ